MAITFECVSQKNSNLIVTTRPLATGIPQRPLDDVYRQSMRTVWKTRSLDLTRTLEKSSYNNGSEDVTD